MFSFNDQKQLRGMGISFSKYRLRRQQYALVFHVVDKNKGGSSNGVAKIGWTELRKPFFIERCCRMQPRFKGSHVREHF